MNFVFLRVCDGVACLLSDFERFRDSCGELDRKVLWLSVDGSGRGIQNYL